MSITLHPDDTVAVTGADYVRTHGPLSGVTASLLRVWASRHKIRTVGRDPRTGEVLYDLASINRYEAALFRRHADPSGPCNRRITRL